MNEKEFNLLDEHWIRVIDDQCRVSEVSLKDAILNAHNYKALSGELPTQDVAIMRLMLAVLHTVFSRVDENGEDAPLDEDDEDEALERWKALWDKGHFSEKAINEYLNKWKERFWLFHPERPFGQLAGMKEGTRSNALKLNGELSQSGNKFRMFSLYSGSEKESLSYSQAARWLLYLHGYDDVALKPTNKGKEQAGGKMPSAKRGWLGQLGLIYIVGDNLFETLMLNLVMVCDGIIQSEQNPIWERNDVPSKERNHIPIPLNLAELYTVQFRRLLLERKNNRVIGYLDVAGDFLEGDVAFKEPMTLWQKSGKNSSEMIPRKHDHKKQMWREFSSLFYVGDAKTSNSHAGVINWYKTVNNQRKKHIKTAIVSLVYDESKATSLPVINIFSDSLVMHSSLLSELGASWRNIIELEISNCNSLANSAATLAKNLYVASGGSNSKKDKHYAEIPSIAKSQLYFRLDLPFREWLRTIDPENTNEKKKYEKQKEWQETAKRIAYSYAKELVSQSAETALVGHKADGRIYSAPKAMNIFKSELNKIYPKE